MNCQVKVNSNMLDGRIIKILPFLARVEYTMWMGNYTQYFRKWFPIWKVYIDL